MLHIGHSVFYEIITEYYYTINMKTTQYFPEWKDNYVTITIIDEIIVLFTNIN